MLEPVSNSQVVKFGIYELDLRLAELRRNGMRVKLTGQPFQILVILVEHPGELVTREQLKRGLWPSDTFVDFDRGLNAAINRVREALGDSAENPRFVETLPRRGYRFVAPVSGVNGNGINVISPASGLEAEAGPRRKIRAWSDHPVVIKFLPYMVATVVVLALITAVTWWRSSGKVPQITRYSQITSDGQGKSSGYASDPPAPLISDGARLYFVEGPVGTKHLVQVSAEGGETSLLPSSFSVRRVLDVSLGRHELLVSAAGERLEKETPLMIMPLPAGPPHRVGNILGHDGSWSPDGAWIVYAGGRSLFLADGNGNHVHKLAEVAGSAWWPRWSQDGKTIRFTVVNLGSQNPVQEIWEVLADGSRLHRAFADLEVPTIQCCGNWTTDGKYYVFSSPDFFGAQLWALREHPGVLGGVKVFRLSAGPMSMASALPSAGNKLFAIAQHQRGQLVLYDRQAKQFLPFLKGISATDVDISKDGQWVAYVSFPEGVLWRSRIDGSQQLQLTLSPMQVSLPRWSPDGNRIAFVGDEHIYLVPRDGGVPEPATKSMPIEGEPTWSPDGGFLAFAPWFWLDGKSGISMLDLQKGTVKALPGSEGLFSPRYSPDGKYIAALTTDASTLMLIDLKAGTKRKLCEGVAYPNWARDGDYINFNRPYQEDTGLYRVHVNDGKIEKLASLEPSFLSWAIVGKWTGLAADDSPLVLRDTSLDEIYALDWDAQ